MKKDIWVECNVCKARYMNWVGSTPCCGSIAWIIEDNIVSKNLFLRTVINKAIEPSIITIQ